MTWVCEECYAEMDVEDVEPGVHKVSCPRCGNIFFVDDDDEQIDDYY